MEEASIPSIILLSSVPGGVLFLFSTRHAIDRLSKAHLDTNLGGVLRRLVTCGTGLLRYKVASRQR